MLGYHGGACKSQSALTLDLTTGARSVLWVRRDAFIVLHGVLMWMTWAVLANVDIGTNHFR